jgi:DNA/RNA endonuclease G (NUC1)
MPSNSHCPASLDWEIDEISWHKKLLKNKCMSIVFNNEFRIPTLTKVVITPEMLEKPKIRARFTFHKVKIKGLKTAKRQDYHRSGFHRSHLVQGALLNNSIECKKATYTYVNVVPMYPTCNTRYWRFAEKVASSFIKLDNVPSTIVTKAVIKDQPTYMEHTPIVIPDSFIMCFSNKHREFCFDIPNLKSNDDYLSYLETHGNFNCSDDTINQLKHDLESHYFDV